mmetsp:Transcript_4204/g.9415  ORF Transcript_4204/g.9415 Transcript_4204/m.9415 type:complete len:668 (-) Transcript_4204:5-2008(-)
MSIDPTLIQSTLSNNATSTTTAQPHKHSPRISPRNSSRHSPKSKNNIMFPSRKYTILKLLGILILFSIITNVFFWSGNPFKQNQSRHYGFGGTNSRMTEAAWSPLISRNNRVKRVFRDGKLKRRISESAVGQHAGDTPESHSNHNNGVQHEQQSDYNTASSDRMHHSKRIKSTPTRTPYRDRKEDERHHQRNSKVASSERLTSVRSGRKENTPKRKPEDNAKRKKKRKESRDRQRLPREFQPLELEMKETNGTMYKERKEIHNQHGEQPPYQRRLRLFRPHPSRETRRSAPWSLPLPARTKESITFHRLVLLDVDLGVPNATHDSAKLDGWLARYDESSRSGNATEDDLAWRSQTVVWDNDEECVPMAEWQKTFHPTCNSLHEMDVSLLLHDSAFSLVSSKGHWRNAWKVDMAVAESHVSATVESSLVSDRSKRNDHIAVNKYAVMKSLKYIHDPNEEVFELSRVDAVSLDVLTRSRFTINIYGFCGTSSMQEFAGGDLKGLLPKLNPIDKLRMAAWVAEGVADIHTADSPAGVGGEKANPRKNEIAVDFGNNDEIENKSAPDKISIPPLIHNDINMDNVLLGYRQGVEMPILNDFNIAVFRKKDARTGEPCRFRGRFANPQWMSPEQQERSEDGLSSGYLNEKIDIYALGNILYKIAVGNSPWKVC